GFARALEPEIGSPYKRIAPKNRQRVVAELSLLLGHIHFPFVIEVEQGPRPVASGNNVERREQGNLVESGGVQRAPRARHPASGDLAKVFCIAGERVMSSLKILDFNRDDLAVSEHLVSPLRQFACRHGAGEHASQHRIADIATASAVQAMESVKSDGLAYNE